MGHCVRAFVGARTILELVQRQFDLSRVVDLDQGLSLLPLSDPLYDAVPGDLLSPSRPGFVLLTPKIEALLKDTSTYGTVGYFETDYFGGTGKQGAVLAQLGEFVFGPQVEPGSINQILAKLGVRRKTNCDEFDAIGLGRFRDTESWVEQPSVRPSAETMTLTGSIISWIHRLGKK